MHEPKSIKYIRSVHFNNHLSSAGVSRHLNQAHTNTLLTSFMTFRVKMNPNKYRLIFSLISKVTADPDFPVGIYEWRLLCGPEFIVFVQQFDSSAEFYFMVAGQMKGFPPLGLDKQ